MTVEPLFEEVNEEINKEEKGYVLSRVIRIKQLSKRWERKVIEILNMFRGVSNKWILILIGW